MSSLLERRTNSLASEGRSRLRLAAGRRRRVEEHGASWSSMVMGFELAGCSCRYSLTTVGVTVEVKMIERIWICRLHLVCLASVCRLPEAKIMAGEFRPFPRGRTRENNCDT